MGRNRLANGRGRLLAFAVSVDVARRRERSHGIGAPSWTTDYGNETANHFDHVHIATDGGGYPTGNETYCI